VEEWVKKNHRVPEGTQVDGKLIIEISKAPPEIQEVWLKLIRGPAEDLIKQANRQIRDTKERMSLPLAKGVILIANDGNHYQNHPESFRRLLAEILRKRTKSRELRFEHIHAGVYFSFGRVKSRDENMNFWANFQMQRHPEEDLSQIVRFQTELQQGFYKFIEKVFQVPVRQHTKP